MNEHAKSTVDELTYSDKQRILRDAVLGVALTSTATEAEKLWRATCDKDVQSARDNGYTIDPPFDWDGDERVTHRND